MEHASEVVINCLLCGKILDDGQPTVCIGNKGLEGIRMAAEMREESINVISGQRLHVDCRRNYCDSRLIEQNKKRMLALDENNGESPVFKSLCSAEVKFSFREHCLFCGNKASVEK